MALTEYQKKEGMKKGRLKVEAPVIRQSETMVEVTSTFRDPTFTQDFYAHWEGEKPPSELEACHAMLCFTLHPAMAMGLDLEIDGPVSAQWLHQAQTIQEMLVYWLAERRLRPIEIHAREVICHEPLPAELGVMSAFTSGVDSLHTLRREEERITHLLYVHGFDVKLGDKTRRELLAGACRDAAKTSGKRLVEVVTNLRHYTDRHTDWVTETHGAALSGIAHLLSGEVGTFVIPSTNTYDRIDLIGSDPQLDPLFSSGCLKVEHVGCEATRTGKLASIADWPLAQRCLRVCTSEAATIYPNCGNCEKCARTQAGLVAIGAYDAFENRFAEKNIAGVLAGIEMRASRNPRSDWTSVREALKKPDLDHEQQQLRDLLDQKMQEKAVTLLGKQLNPVVKEVVKTEAWRAIAREHRAIILESLLAHDPEWVMNTVRSQIRELRPAILTKLAKNPRWLRRRATRAKWAARWLFCRRRS